MASSARSDTARPPKWAYVQADGRRRVQSQDRPHDWHTAGRHGRSRFGGAVLLVMISPQDGSPGGREDRGGCGHLPGGIVGGVGRADLRRRLVPEFRQPGASPAAVFAHLPVRRDRDRPHPRALFGWSVSSSATIAVLTALWVCCHHHQPAHRCRDRRPAHPGNAAPAADSGSGVRRGERFADGLHVASRAWMTPLWSAPTVTRGRRRSSHAGSHQFARPSRGSVASSRRCRASECGRSAVTWPARVRRMLLPRGAAARRRRRVRSGSGGGSARRHVQRRSRRRTGSA
jgi:hypothetical protein